MTARYIRATTNSVVYSSGMESLTGIINITSGYQRIDNRLLFLLSFEMNFINRQVTYNEHKPPLIVYIGAGCDDHLIKLMELYNFIEFHLYNEEDCSELLLGYIYNNKERISFNNFLPSEEQCLEYRRLDKMVYLISNYTSPDLEIKSNKLYLMDFEMDILSVRTVKDQDEVPNIVYVGDYSEKIIRLTMLYDFVNFQLFFTSEYPEELLEYLSENENRISINEGEPTRDEYRKFKSKNKTVYLISDRVTNESNEDKVKLQEIKKNFQDLKELLNLKDSEKNINFAKWINAECSLLKFRPPHVYSDKTVANYNFTFFEGSVLLPIFGGFKSSESRIEVNNYELIKWDYKIFTDNINIWNFRSREYSALNPFSGKLNPLPNQLGNQMEICIFFAILRDYYITAVCETVSESDVYNLYSRFIIGKSDNSEICG